MSPDALRPWLELAAVVLAPFAAAWVNDLRERRRLRDVAAVMRVYDLAGRR